MTTSGISGQGRIEGPASGQNRNHPPPLAPARVGRPPRYWPSLAGVAVLLSGAYAHFALKWDWPLPQCLLRKFTGIPCPSCGCTRSLAAWTQFDLEQAFRFNPLFFVVCLIAIAWIALTSFERLAGRPWLPDIRLRLQRWPLWRVGLVLVVLNWLYLCLTLPK